MIGFAVIAPKLVAFACNRKRQRALSRGIVRASRSVAVAARWLALLPFADVQETLAARAPQPAATPANRSAAATAATRRDTDERRWPPPDTVVSGTFSPAAGARRCQTQERCLTPRRVISHQTGFRRRRSTRARISRRRQRSAGGETPPALTSSICASEATALCDPTSRG